MKNLVLIMALVGAGLYFFWPGTKELAPQDFAEALETQTNEVLIDLRPAKEFCKGHIAGATNIDSGWPTYKWRVSEVDSTLPVCLYCEDGQRSAKTAFYLKMRGFEDLTILKGGLKSWREENYQLTPEELTPPLVLTLKEFSSMMAREHLVIVDFYLPGNKKCRQIEPAIDDLAIAYRGMVKILRIDIDTYKHLAAELGIESVPTLHFYENGNLTGWIEGVNRKDRIEGEFGLREYLTMADGSVDR